MASALGLARRGLRVTVVERDPTPMPKSADEAFEWDRRGAPQVRHSHAFLARLRNLLREHYPDVLDDLLRAGAKEMTFAQGIPETMIGYTPDESDEELVLLACRRTTFEWVVRRAASREGLVDFRVGSGVAGLLFSPGTPPVVTGVRLEDGTELAAPLTVVANGRRSAAPDWLADIGAAIVEEEVEDTGIVYFSRFYRLNPDAVVGIPEADLDKIFDPFFTTKPVGKGTGLGLSITDAILRDHEGTITASNRKPRGVVFVVALPGANG